MRAPARLALVALALPLLALPVALRAQDYEDMFDNPYLGQPKSLSLEAFGGAYWSTPWNDLVLLGSVNSGNTVEQVLLRQVQVQADRVYGGSVTYRRGRGGFRVEASYAESCLQLAGSCDPLLQGSATQVPLPRRIGVNTWTADVAAEVSLVPIKGGEAFRPFLLIGGGAVVYAPKGGAAQLLPQFLDITGGTSSTIGTQVTVEFPGAGTVVADVRGIGMETMFSGVLGAGTDVRVPIGNGGVGLRLQAIDHITNSPMHVSILQGFTTPQPATFNFGSIQNIRVSAGVVVDFDLGRVGRKPPSSEQ